MSAQPNTLFLHLDGPLQAWARPSRHMIRAAADAPTKSGVLGMICCALGVPRRDTREALRRMNRLVMGVRIDRPGRRISDYHTAGAKIGLMSAGGRIKITESTGEIETLVSRREYLCDASFLVALRGEPETIRRLADGLAAPRWPVYLGRKSCPPSVPVFNAQRDLAHHDALDEALASHPWRPRLRKVDGEAPQTLRAVIELPAGQPLPDDADWAADVPVSFSPPAYAVRGVRRIDLPMVDPGPPAASPTPRAGRKHADYTSTQWRTVSHERIRRDHHLCVFCKAPADHVHHTSYREIGREDLLDLRSLCRLCHDAVTMLEYGHNLGMERIDPCDSRWRPEILRCRDDILRWRSVSQRRRMLNYKEL